MIAATRVTAAILTTRSRLNIIGPPVLVASVGYPVVAYLGYPTLYDFFVCVIERGRGGPLPAPFLHARTSPAASAFDGDVGCTHFEHAGHPGPNPVQEYW